MSSRICFLLFLLTMSLFSLPGVSAGVYSQVNTIYWSANTSDSTVGRGVVVQAHENITLINATLSSGANPTFCNLMNGGTTILMNGTISGSVVTFNYNLTKNSQYRLECHKNGAAYTSAYNNSAQGFPITNQFLSIVNGSFSRANNTNNLLFESFNIDALNETPSVLPSITVFLVNAVTGVAWPNSTSFNNVNTTGQLNFSYFNITSQGFCVTYTGNGTGTNCTAGSGTSTFYNVTNTTNITVSANVYASTYQGVLNITASRLFLNTSVTSFNATDLALSNTTTGGAVFLRALNGSNNVRIDVAGNYSMNASCTVSSPFTTANCVIAGVYDNQFTIGAKNGSSGVGITNFTVSTNNTALGFSVQNATTSGVVRYNLLQGYPYYFFLNATGFAYENITYTANASANLYNFSLYGTNTINITFYDEMSNLIINWTTIYLEFIGEYRSGNLTTTTGLMTLNVVVPGSYMLRYTATDYPQRFYEFTVADGSFSRLNLTLLNSSASGYANVTVTVKDTLDNYLEAATVKLLKYDVTTNTYSIQQIADTNFEGQVRFNLLSESEYYKFVVEYDGDTVLTTSPTYIYGNSITLIVDLTSGSGFTRATTNSGYSGNITVIPGYDYASFNYNDDSNTATQGCVYVYQITQSGRSLYNSTCSASSSGTTMTAISNSTGSSYYAEGYITDPSGYSHLVAATGIEYDAPIPENDGESLLLMFFVMALLATLGVWKIEVGILLSSIVPLLFSIMGLAQIGIIVAIPVFVLGIVAAYIIAVK